MFPTSIFRQVTRAGFPETFGVFVNLVSSIPGFKNGNSIELKGMGTVVRSASGVKRGEPEAKEKE